MKKEPTDFNINLSQAVQLTGRDFKTVKKLIRQGKISGYCRENRLRTQWYISFNSVMRYVEKSTKWYLTPYPVGIIL